MKLIIEQVALLPVKACLQLVARWVSATTQYKPLIIFISHVHYLTLSTVAR